MRIREIEEYVFKYGEKFRPVIVDALEWLDKREASWGLDTSINVSKFLENLIERANA
jgi:hypothetical protein